MSALCRPTTRTLHVATKRRRAVPSTAHLRQFHLSPLVASSPPSTHKQTLAILGAGLSGLSTAHYYLRALDPAARAATRIVVLEKERRVGGWCRAHRYEGGRLLKPDEQPQGKGDVLAFETGPRSIRPQGLLGWLTIEMAHDLGLTLDSSLVVVPKSAPSARNRYLYTPPTLTLLPSSLLSALKAIFTTPLIRRILPSLLLEPFRPRSPLHDAKDPDAADESVDSFFARRFGRTLADDMLSAMIHGIYAGDSRRLSVRAVFPQLWDAEREWGSVVLSGLFGGLARRKGWKTPSAWRVRADEDVVEMRRIKERIGASGDEGRRLVEAMEGASVWGVKGGVEGLTEALRDRLKGVGVEFWMGDRGKVEEAEKVDGGWKIRTSDGELDATQLVTTNPQLLPPGLAPPPLPSATVSVVNLAFSVPSSFTSTDDAPRLFPPGFGYLIPRTVPLSSNPHRALGCIFDSDVLPNVDASASHHLTKVSLLLGGSYWLDAVPQPGDPRLEPDALVAAALDTLRLHFPDVDLPDPAYALTSTHRDCIPQVPPGSRPQFRAFGQRLAEAGGVAVVGGGYASVGMNGAVKSAWEVGTSFARAVNEGDEGHEAEKKAREVVRTGTEMWQL
ncbi:hypothetical protein JCM9279_004402 [Rhodotorula babjevae]